RRSRDRRISRPPRSHAAPARIGGRARFTPRALPGVDHPSEGPREGRPRPGDRTALPGLRGGAPRERRSQALVRAPLGEPLPRAACPPLRHRRADFARDAGVRVDSRAWRVRKRGTMKLILVGLDASVRAEGVLDAAIDLARRTGHELVLFRAVGVPHEIPVEAYTMNPTSLVELLEKNANRYLDEVSVRVPAELLADRVVHIGVPWQGICDAADRLDVRLIVIGSHGYSGLDRVL